MRFVNPYVFGVFALSGVVPLWGCSGSSNGNPPAPIVGTGATVSQPVTPAGGTVSVPGGGSLTIPAGAVSGNQTITVQSTTSAPPSGVTNLSPVYQFGPAGLVFNKPVTIQLNFTSNGNAPSFAWTNLNSTVFGILPSTVSGSTVSAQVTHFSQGFVADGTTTMMLSPGSDDAGAPSVEDAGAPSVDATVPAADGGAPSLDSGQVTANEDAGGSSTPDAGMRGAPDSGPGAQDDGGSQSSCAVCANGSCEPACPAGSTTCGSSNTCVNTDSDPANCGTCGQPCSSTQTCSGGHCVASCGGSALTSGCGASPQEDGGVDCSFCGNGYSACGSACVQTATDPNNCGQCGNACKAGQFCSSGTCTSNCPGSDVCAGNACAAQCPSGQVVCSAAPAGGTSNCTNLQVDPSHCGACGTTCGTGQQCVAGSCVASCYGSETVNGCAASPNSDGGINCSACGSGYSACGQQCVQTASDPNNCGGCNHVCARGQTCSSGSCVALCPGSDVCTAGGTCAASCPAGQSMCDSFGPGITSTCSNVQSDAENCGSCGHACGTGQLCTGGACVASCGGSHSADAGVGANTDGGGGSPAPDAGEGCVPVPSQVACGSECGVSVGNGCGGMYECPSCGPDDDAGSSGGPDAGGCVPFSQPKACMNFPCGSSAPNGCGGMIACPACSGGPDAGSSGGEDASSGCIPQTNCPPTFCGKLPDGCGGTIVCNNCDDDAGMSEAPDAGGCVPSSCLPGQCGQFNNGCGKFLTCGPCGQDDAGPCTPIPPQQACGGFPCGQSVPNGCGGLEMCSCGGLDAGG